MHENESVAQSEQKNAPSRKTEPHPEEVKATPAQELGEMAKVAIIAVLLAVIFRTFVFEPFNIPSGSMKPNLLVGDYLFVSKSSYGYSRYSFPTLLTGAIDFEGRINEDKPKRGDVAVFKLPTNTSIDYIKRVVGMPGETLQMINGRLYINREQIPRELVGHKRVKNASGRKSDVKEYIETLPGGIIHTIYEEDSTHPLDNTEEFIVPEGHYFMMGDNRDNSQDSRATDMVGFVPYENFVGRAEFLFFSIDGSFFEFWKWPWSIRGSRIFDSIGVPQTGENAQ